MFIDSAPPLEKSLNINDNFTFACHNDLACFNSCCCNKHLPLSPYDILRMKNALQLHSDKFLSIYTLYRTDPVSGFPIIQLRMEDDMKKSCPFVSQEGCGIYRDRPAACRLFPMGRVACLNKEHSAIEEVYHLLDIPACLGFMEEKSWTVGAWVKDQDLKAHLAFNDLYLKVLFHKKRDSQKALEEKQLQKIMVACYNLDLFRDFVFKTNFLELFEINQDKAELLGNDEELLKLGLTYLDKTLF